MPGTGQQKADPRGWAKLLAGKKDSGLGKLERALFRAFEEFGADDPASVLERIDVDPVFARQLAEFALELNVSVRNHPDLTMSERLAAEILGVSRVLGYRDVCRVWGVEPPETEPGLRFAEGTIEEVLMAAAKSNAALEKPSNLVLAYVNGLSFNQQLKKRHTTTPRFNVYDSFDWSRSQPEWCGITASSGYRLLDFTKRFTQSYWSYEETQISDFGDQYERAEEQVVAEVCFSGALLDHPRPMRWGHRGRVALPNDKHLYVGFFDGKSLSVGCHSDVAWLSSQGVVLSRKMAG